MEKANTDVRKAAKAARVPLWMVADHLELTETAMTRKLRRELPEEEKAQILAAIQELREAADD